MTLCHKDTYTVRQGKLPGRILAAPSWVFPGSIEENCFFLQDKVDEVGLLFFEAASSLAYTREHLPSSLAGLSLRYHMHLPSDVFAGKVKDAAYICLQLFEKTSFLGRLQGVLHPPAAVLGREECCRQLREFLEVFRAGGGDPAQLLLENIKENDLSALQDVIEEYDLRICLDMGHVLAYGQYGLIGNSPLLRRAGMIHVNAPGGNGEESHHKTLVRLASHELALAESMVQSIPKHAVIMMELFAWQDVVESLPLVQSWLGAAAHCK